MDLRKFLILTILVFAVAQPAQAIKIEGGDFASSFHIGVVSGFGLGINFGLDAGFPMGDFEFGAEIEQSITDYEFEVSVNTTKLGILLRYQIIEDLLWAGLHAGSMRFSVSKDTTFTDVSSGDKIPLLAADEHKATYISASLDYRMGELLLTPRVYMNNMVDGAFSQVDLNLGVKF